MIYAFEKNNQGVFSSSRSSGSILKVFPTPSFERRTRATYELECFLVGLNMYVALKFH